MQIWDSCNQFIRGGNFEITTLRQFIMRYNTTLWFRLVKCVEHVHISINQKLNKPLAKCFFPRCYVIDTSNNVAALAIKIAKK